MGQFEALILIVFLSWTALSSPICRLSYWVNSEDLFCSRPPNGTYAALVYNDTCSPSLGDPSKTFYKLLIDPQTRIIHNFTVHSDQTCTTANKLLFGQSPALLNACGPLYLMTRAGTVLEIGRLIFNCEDQMTSI